MAFTNYASITLRASAVTSGASEQDTAVTLPETVTQFWVKVTKTAENNIDNLLTVRIQAQVDSIWFDLAWDWVQQSQVLSTAASIATDVTRDANIVDVNTTTPTYSVLGFYSSVPSNVVRVASVSSGTGVLNTFGVEASYALNRL